MTFRDELIKLSATDLTRTFERDLDVDESSDKPSPGEFIQMYSGEYPGIVVFGGYLIQLYRQDARATPEMQQSFNRGVTAIVTTLIMHAEAQRS